MLQHYKLLKDFSKARGDALSSNGETLTLQRNLGMTTEPGDTIDTFTSSQLIAYTQQLYDTGRLHGNTCVSISALRYCCSRAVLFGIWSIPVEIWFERYPKLRETLSNFSRPNDMYAIGMAKLSVHIMVHCCDAIELRPIVIKNISLKLCRSMCVDMGYTPETVTAEVLKQVISELYMAEKDISTTMNTAETLLNLQNA